MENVAAQTPASPVPSEATFTLTLSRLIQGAEPVIANAHCVFSYHWDFSTNMGEAKLVSINNCEQDIVLHPLGISGALDFMSDMEPQHVVINGQRVVLYRVILDIDLESGERSAAIMFNEDGSVIQGTENFGRTDTLTA